MDHRSIEWLVIDGVKYYFGNKSEKNQQVVEMSSQDVAHVREGDWFSAPQCYNLVNVRGDLAYLADCHEDGVIHTMPLSKVPNAQKTRKELLHFFSKFGAMPDLGY